jgi:hypothetical protein
MRIHTSIQQNSVTSGREIEYHHARTNTTGIRARIRTAPSLTVAAQDAAVRSAAEIGRVASVFYDAAQGVRSSTSTKRGIRGTGCSLTSANQ